MTLACEAILAGQEEKNPYEISYHLDDCPERIWADEDIGLLVTAEEVGDRGCDACLFEWNLWTRILEDTGDRCWGEIALTMLELDEYIETFGIRPEEITAAEWSYLRAVRHERSRRDVYRTWRAGQKTESSK